MQNTNSKSLAKQSLSYIIHNNPDFGLPAVLRRYPERNDPGDEWEDTAAIFSTDVLKLHPDITPHPTAKGYGVGYGSLVAVEGPEKNYSQIAYWDGKKWADTTHLDPG